VALAPSCLVSFEEYPVGEIGPDASSGGVGGSAGSGGSGAGTWADACVPKTCSDLNAECGTESDGCGAILDCGGCTASGTCADNICNCTPTSCAAEGKNCGQLPDGCGGTLDCGACIAGQVCGGAGTPNVCAAGDAGSCTPKSCQDQGKQCGIISDLCGATLDCGGCLEMNHVCTLTNTCLCLPKTCGTAACGTLDDGCNGTIACGSCTSGKVCNPQTNQCCVPMTDGEACSFANAQCGLASNGCGGSVDCGACVASETCNNNKCS
jgi:hypothetical protein